MKKLNSKVSVFFMVFGYLSLVFPAFGSEIVCSSMVAGGTDNSRNLEECINKAMKQPEKIVRLPAGGPYLIRNIFTIPEGVTITGTYSGLFDPLGKNKNTTTVNATFRVSSNSRLFNLNFEDRSRAVIMGDGSAPRGQGFVENAEIRNNSFGFGSWATLMAYRINDCIIDNNKFIGVVGNVGQNIQILGGKRNIISNNYTYGQKTSIIFKYSRNANGGGYPSMLEDNVVSGNTVERFSEEGISFDVVGDSSEQVAAFEYDTISSSHSGNRIKLSHPNWGASKNPDYIGYDMIFLSGNLGGRTRQIIGQLGATFTVNGSIVGVANGDEIVIGATFKRNHIHNNTVINRSGSSILFFGMGFQNVIENNTLDRGSIDLRSLKNTEKPLDSVTGEYGRAPNGYNLIRNNIVGSIGSPVSNISTWLRDVGLRKGQQSSVPDYYSYGNAVIDNLVDNRFYATYQKNICERGNTWNNSDRKNFFGDKEITVFFVNCSSNNWEKDDSWAWLDGSRPGSILVEGTKPKQVSNFQIY